MSWIKQKEVVNIKTFKYYSSFDIILLSKEPVNIRICNSSSNFSEELLSPANKPHYKAF